MAKSAPHDHMDQNADENDLVDAELEDITGTGETISAEESAINTDNVSAREASGDFENEAIAEEIAAEVEEEVEEKEKNDIDVDKKHKNRESTSEKAKKAAIERVAKGEAVSEGGAPTKKLDPLRNRGKNYKTKLGLVVKTNEYSVEEAMELVKQTSYSKFTGAVEMHIKVRGDSVRGTIVLPHGNGKTKKVAVADDDTLEAIAAGKIDFDVLIATPAQMPKLAKYAKILGPKGLMPSPKAGTVTEDIEGVRKEIAGGRIEYRADKTKAVHMSIGKTSFTVEQLVENYKVVETILLSQKIMSITVCATQGPGIKVKFAK